MSLATPRSVIVGLGANLGEPILSFRSAIKALDVLDGVKVSARSSLYQTAPIGPDQPDYINAAVRLECALEPLALLRRCLEIERAHGRDRAKEIRFGPRTLDLDLLYFEGAEIESEELTLPHPRLHERAFALTPLLEIAPELSARYEAALAQLAQDIRRLEGEAL